MEHVHDLKPDVLAADKAYGRGLFLNWLDKRNVTAHVPVLDREHQRSGLLSRKAFTFDADNNYFGSVRKIV